MLLAWGGWLLCEAKIFEHGIDATCLFARLRWLAEKLRHVERIEILGREVSHLQPHVEMLSPALDPERGVGSSRSASSLDDAAG